MTSAPKRQKQHRDREQVDTVRWMGHVTSFSLDRNPINGRISLLICMIRSDYGSHQNWLRFSSYETRSLDQVPLLIETHASYEFPAKHPKRGARGGYDACGAPQSNVERTHNTVRLR